MVYFSTSNGSALLYKLDFGDDSPVLAINENSTRLSPNEPDIHYIDHTYQIPGNYVVSLSVENTFGSRNVNLSNQIIVQNPLDGKFILQPFTIQSVPFPPGSVTFNASLVKSGLSFLDLTPASGWADNVHAKWFLSRSDGNELLLETYGDHDIGWYLI